MHAARVLLAEPDGSVQSAVAELLEAAGFVVLHTDGGPNQPPADVAVVWLTPSANRQTCKGLGVAQALSEARIPFIVVAPDAGDTLRQTAIELGAIGYFIQPVDASVLVQSIQAGIRWFAKWRRLSEHYRSVLDALAESRSIGTAVGIIAERHQLTPQEAFERLRRQARDERRTVANLAAGVVSGTVDVSDGRSRHLARR